MKTLILSLLTLSATLALAFQASAHPVSVTSTIADVYADKIEVDIEVMLEDLVLYHGLTADGQMRYSATDLKSAVEKHRQFLLEYFTILDGEGQRLTGEVVSVTTDQIDSAAIGQSELMRRTIGFKLRYPLSARPTFLTFRQTFGGSQATLPAVMDLHVLRNGSFGGPGAQLPHGRPHTVQLDWNDNPSGKRLTLAEVRQQRKAQLEQRLGIASYTGMFSFIYINHYEVRHEILVPLLTLEQWLPIARKDNDFVEVAEQQAALPAIEQFLREKQQVIINGKLVEPKVMKVSFFGLDINDFALNAEPRPVNVVQARVGVIVSFPASETPRSVSLKWSAYNEYAPSVSSVILVGDVQPVRHDFQSIDDTYQWTGELSQTNITPVAAKTFSNEAASNKAFEQLLTNIYQAFEVREDEQVYDALAQSVDGPLLRDVYLRVKRTLVMAEQGGALARVRKVTIEKVDTVKSNEPHTFEVTWQAVGESEHWGHLHTRTSQYRARLTLIEKNGLWKLTRFQPIDEKRIQFETRIRGYDSNP